MKEINKQKRTNEMPKTKELTKEKVKLRVNTLRNE